MLRWRMRTKRRESSGRIASVAIQRGTVFNGRRAFFLEVLVPAAPAAEASSRTGEASSTSINPAQASLRTNPTMRNDGRASEREHMTRACERERLTAERERVRDLKSFVS